jgi:hypothetical protein
VDKQYRPTRRVAGLNDVKLNASAPCDFSTVHHISPFLSAARKRALFEGFLIGFAQPISSRLARHSVCRDSKAMLWTEPQAMQLDSKLPCHR